MSSLHSHRWPLRVVSIAIIGALVISTESGASAETPPKALPTEQVDFGSGELVTLRARTRESTKWVIGRELSHQFESLANRARSGDAEVAENLSAALSKCERAPRTKEELDDAVELMRSERKQVLPDGVMAQITSSADIEDLVWQLLVDPYETCKGLTDAQRGSARQWLDLAVELGNADAAIAALEFATKPFEQQRLRELVWRAGEPDVLGGEAHFYEQRSRSSDAKPDDLVQAYAHQFALNEIAKFFAREYPPRPIRQRLHDGIASELDRIGSLLTVEQRNAAVGVAADIVRSNPNCCSII